MDAAQVANLAASALVAATAGVAATVYHLRARWWRTPWGRNVMSVTVSVGLLGLYTVLVTLVWPTGPVLAALRVTRTVVLVLLAALLLQRTGLVLDAQREVPARK
jgi:hypothetical protein